MKLYQNIQNRRLELNLSQSELAYRVGYKDKGSISRIENGLIDLTQSQIEKFASALGCTPAYLMGWDENTSATNKKNILEELESIKKYIEETQTNNLSSSEKELINKLRKLDDDGLQHVYEVLDREITYARLRQYERKIKKRKEEG